MKLINARTSFAPAPRNTGNPDPDELRPAGQVENPEPLPDLPMGLPTHGPRSTPRAHDRVTRRVAVRQLRERNVGNEQAFGFEGRLEIALLVFERADARAKLLALRQHIGRDRALFFHEIGIGAGSFVALCLELVELAGHAAAAQVERLDFVEQLPDPRIAAARERGAHLIWRGAQELEIDHAPTAWGGRA